jgi:hypothetical protein
VQVSHRLAAESAVFDDDNLVSCAGLVPVMTLAHQTGLGRLFGEKVQITAPRIKSGAANPAPKLATVVAGMCAGADCIDDIDVLRSGGMKTLFDGVYAPSTVGTLLREFTFGHARHSSRCYASIWWRCVPGSICCPAPPGRCSSTSIRCCVRSTGTPSRAPPTGTPRSPASRCCARDCLRW